jgi:hypothetical protein
LPATALVAVLGAATLVVLSGEDDVPVAALPDRPTIAGSLELEPRLPVAGQEVVVRATLSADRPLALHGLAVRVRDASGAAHDFPEPGERGLGTTPRDITLRRAFPAVGDYTYYLAYRLDGDWVTLQPWEVFTVR